MEQSWKGGDEQKRQGLDKIRINQKGMEIH